MAGKIAKILLKIFIFLFVASVITSAVSIIPAYLQLRQTANSILLRTTLNNYITFNELRDYLEDTYSGDSYAASLICKGDCALTPGGDNSLSSSAYNTGVYVYMAGGIDMTDYPLPSNSSATMWGDKNSRRVILNEGSSFNPKENSDDAFRLDSVYNGVNRGTPITVRLDARIKMRIFVGGTFVTVGFPISTGELTAPAMYYYRNIIN